MLTPEQVADYFLRLVDEDAGDSISNLKLQKLVYYAQAWHLALTSKPLFAEDIEAWAHGPVVPSLYQKYRAFGWEPIHQEVWEPAAIPRPENEAARIPERTTGILDEVWEAYGQFTAKRLEELTHSEAPWRDARARHNCSSGDWCDEVITKKEMKEFYRKRATDS